MIFGKETGFELVCAGERPAFFAQFVEFGA
jgi:hypothetical protein